MSGSWKGEMRGGIHENEKAAGQQWLRIEKT
jgi:hypothetical protein